MGYIFNYHTQIIDITSPQTTLDIQDLVNEVRQAEFDNTGLAYAKICDASGKASLGGGVVTGITMYLYPDWQIRWWSGTYQAQVTGGNLIGGLGNQPFAYTAGVQIILVQSASATIVSGGTALTLEESDKLMTGLDISIPDAVWDELLASHQTVGSAGRELTTARKKATLSSLK